MHLNTNNRIRQIIACAALCFTAAPCFPEAPQPPLSNANLTPASIKHTVECLSPKKDLCVIKKPVGTGYRILTPEITLEDAGEYWLADFIKTKLTGKKLSFRVMGKDNDIHEIDILFQKTKSATKKEKAPGL